MTRRSGWILLTLGVLLAIGAGALVYVVLQQQSVAAAEQARREVLAQQAPQVPTIKLPVAARSLTPGNAIGPDDILLKDFPVDLVPVNALTETTQIESRVLARAVGQGDPFQKSMFVGERGESVSQEIPPGYVLFAFPIVDLLGQSNLIEDGDRIDLYLTLNTPLNASASPAPDQPTTPTTALTLQNVQVLKVLRSEPREGETKTPAIALLCAMRPEDAIILKHIKDTGGTIDFALRSPLDTEPFTAEPLDLPELIQRYMR
ncbi:MAG: Flp pilus assembly protein CpaB [Roseiflexus sp.]|uniref:Flp pilus assembly protein CpaB n=1 Tax=Roseiflexus sp. TaxID=2562120 RepID=UPI0025E26C16|nr:Flp pilus assembly protein CpaB [Roseiflexus sp.]MCL6542132.1 Flp pilus assembly protein CpaB [Roseiflexus sp.]